MSGGFAWPDRSSDLTATMSERRYNDEEVAAIFLRAAEEPQAAPVRVPREEGLTLRELQEIGREVGIPPDAVAQAAQTVENVLLHLAIDSYVIDDQ